MYDRIIIEVMCADSAGRKIITPLWGGKTTLTDYKIPWHTFHQVFTETLKPDWKKLRSPYLQCLKAILCNRFDDSVEFQQFCKVVAWFGPLIPVNDFFSRLKEVSSLPGFHGVLSEEKATQLTNKAFTSFDSKSTVYLYFLRNSDPLGGFTLLFVERKTNKLNQKRIERQLDGSLICYDISKGGGTPYPNFTQLNKTMISLYGLKKPVPESFFVTFFKNIK
eukprot:TRINITY_DN7883_c0_g2_i2.p1 TRINITY_DN7883_c0_g2~~TRINITY_DN7883_c0_g2_i2.p1  ORF type:complete len:221 (+),score=36.14 TRINITY_DN7883_c0_g2_i2:328-990(+)